ncbi:DUF6456 domain-containing protein [Pararhizobium sp. BT-229]|uniref:DUF6456 domain-containing protein n=1 Tax=Pararhizobium sp. BT-229 TaxID=2986923 RepID=UPI0021F72FDA|nr:DUF6456 domain-containing protein [Pararhizobium sp. BT-229]MCV9963433.1 DUF6456 domain-containing protein [Pararhizobium sp. BT-229]
MNNGMAAKAGAVASKDVVRLVRYVSSRAPVTVEQVEGGVILHAAADRPSRPFLRDVLEVACSLGLVVRKNGRVNATAEAPAFLRRALLAPEEAFQEQHRDGESRTVSVDGVRQAVRVNPLESPLGAIARLKERSGQMFLPPEAIAAGERLHADFTRAQLQPRLTMAYEPRLSSKTKAGAGGIADLCDTALAARQRVARAMEAIGPELCGVALDVCCFQKGLEIVERERQWPARSAKLMLRTALMALARHYAPPRAAARQNHAWGGEGYRPDGSSLGTGIMPPVAGQPLP